MNQVSPSNNSEPSQLKVILTAETQTDDIHHLVLKAALVDDLDRVRKIMQLIPSDILPDSKKFRRAKQHARFLRQTVKKVMEGHAIMPEEELMISQVCNAVLDSENAGGSLQPFFLELVSNMEFENVPPGLDPGMSSHPEQNLSTLLIAFTGKIATSSNLWKEANGFNPMRPGLNWRDEEENEEKGNDGKISVIDPRTGTQDLVTYSIKGSFEGGRVYLLEPVDPPESGEKLVAGFVGEDGNMVTSPVSEPFFLEGLAAHCVCAKKDDTCWYTFATEGDSFVPWFSTEGEPLAQKQFPGEKNRWYVPTKTGEWVDAKNPQNRRPSDIPPSFPMGESIKKGLGKVTPMGVLENGELAHIRYLQIWSEGMGLRDATFPLEATHLLEANGNLFPSSPKSEEGETRDVYGWYSGEKLLEGVVFKEVKLRIHDSRHVPLFISEQSGEGSGDIWHAHTVHEHGSLVPLLREKGGERTKRAPINPKSKVVGLGGTCIEFGGSVSGLWGRPLRISESKLRRLTGVDYDIQFPR